MKITTKEQVVRALRLGGIQNGDVILMHSALSSIGNMEGGAESFIDAVLEAVGPDGTFAVSTMSGGHPFDPETSPSTVGIISEMHRRRPNSIRSLRPVHSINAIGARAEELTRDHEKCETNCGEGSPFLKLRDMGGKIILMGVDMNRNTTLHAIEDIMDAMYLVDHPIPAPKYMPDYENKTMVLRKFCPGHRDFLRFTRELRRADALIEVCIGNALVKIIDVQKMFALGTAKLTEDPLFFLCENKYCPHCSGVRRTYAQQITPASV